MENKISLKEITKIINKIKRARELDNKYYDLMKEFNKDNYTISVAGYLEQTLIDLLKLVFDDKEDTLEYFIYECNFGESYEKGDWEFEEKNVKLYTIEDLYSALCGNILFEV